MGSFVKGQDTGGGRVSHQVAGLACRPFGDDRVAKALIQFLVASRADKGVDHEQRGVRAHASAFLRAGFLAVVAFLAGPLAARAAIRASASSSVISSGAMSLGSVALVLPCLTYGP